VWVKQRWIGRPVVEVLAQEYRGLSLEHYKEEIRRGLVQVNDRMISFEKRFEANECMQHRMHRHEPPVTGEAIKVVYQDDSVVVVDKPGSIPVHPTGRYRHNTVMFILAHDHGIANLYPVHRLDKLTSGLLVFAKNSQRAEKIASEIRSTSVTKTYLARVVGEFPPEKIICTDPILLATDIGMKELNKVHPDGKPCETHFERLSFDGSHSIVQCQPKTGRTHQIRVHLSHLGFPIVNDPLYNESYRNKFAEPWEISMGNNSAGIDNNDDDGDGDIGGLQEEGEEVTSKGGTALPGSVPLASSPSSSSSAVGAQNQGEVDPSSNPSASSAENSTSSAVKDSFDPSSVPHVNIEESDPQPLCHLCDVVWRTPKPHQLCIFLHALSYQSEAFYYETERPAWSLPSYQYEEPLPPPQASS
jgi:RluA family pseudouridine synthase